VATQTVVAAGLAYLIYKGYERLQLSKKDDKPGPDVAPSRSHTADPSFTTTRTVVVEPTDPLVPAPGTKMTRGV